MIEKKNHIVSVSFIYLAIVNNEKLVRRIELAFT